MTRGPGATQAAVGVHTAKQDSSPMILLVGQVPRAFRGREAWQELDYAEVFGGIAKAAWELDSVERIPEHMAEAYSLAVSGRPGPVVLALPEDVLAEEADVADGARVEAPRVAPGSEDLARLRELLAAAERPLVVVGRGRLDGATRAVTCRRSARRMPFPSPCAFRCQDFVDNRSPSYVGVLGVAMDEAIAGRLRDADLVIAIGGRLGEVPTRRYTLLEAPDPTQTLVHIHPDPGELGRVYEPDLAIAATLPEAAAALLALEPVEARWRDWTAAARADYERNLEHEPMEGDVDLGEIMAFLRRRLPDDAIQTCGAGNFTVWAHRFAQFTQFGTQACPRSGSMGYGLPAAVAAQLIHPAARRRLLHRRRRLRDELARARDRGAVRAADRRPAREQRHVRDHSDAPGAAVPGAGDRHRPREPGLRRARARVRRARRAGRADGGLRGGVRAGTGFRQAVGDRACRSIPSGSARASG